MSRSQTEILRQLSKAGAYDSGYAEDASRRSVDPFDLAFERGYKPPRRIPHKLKGALAEAHMAARESAKSGGATYADHVREAKALSAQAHASTVAGAERYIDDDDDHEDAVEGVEDKRDRLAEIEAQIAALDRADQADAKGQAQAPATAPRSAGIPAQGAALTVDTTPDRGFEGDQLTSLADLDRALGTTRPSPVASVPTPSASPAQRSPQLPRRVSLHEVAAALADCEPDLEGVADAAADESPDMSRKVVKNPSKTPGKAAGTKSRQTSTKAGKASFAARVTASATTDHGSPAHIVECAKRALGMRSNAKFDLDPAASTVHDTVPAKRMCLGLEAGDIDGLTVDWRGRVYNNPPYGREITHWTRKAIETMACEDGVVIQLLPMRGPDWFLDDVLPMASAICFVRGRLTFEGSFDPYMVDSIIVLWGDEHVQTFIEAFSVYEPKSLVARSCKRKQLNSKVLRTGATYDGAKIERVKVMTDAKGHQFTVAELEGGNRVRREFGVDDEKLLSWHPLGRPVGRVLDLTAIRSAMESQGKSDD